MQYAVVKSEKLETLIPQVQGLIAKGWEPIGGVAFAIRDQDPQTWAQAMIKKEYETGKEVLNG